MFFEPPNVDGQPLSEGRNLGLELLMPGCQTNLALPKLCRKANHPPVNIMECNGNGNGSVRQVVQSNFTYEKYSELRDLCLICL